MKVVVGSDENTHLVEEVVRDLRRRGHEVLLVGPPAGKEEEWVQVSREVAGSVATGETETGILFCWTGTGASIASNKVRGVRAALCADAQTAAGARRWNDANVLVMSLRSTSPAIAIEMLDAWFESSPDPDERATIATIEVPRHHEAERNPVLN